MLQAAFDAVGFGSVNNAIASSVSFTHTPVGTPTLILAACIVKDTTGVLNPVTGITYNGVAMTPLGSLDINDPTIIPARHTAFALFALFNPPAGAQTVVASWTNSLTVGAVCESTSWLGTSLIQALTLGATGTTQVNTPDTTPSITLSGYKSTSLLFGALGVDHGSTVANAATVGAGETQRYNLVTGSGAALNRVKNAGSSQDPGGDGVLNWNLASTAIWGMIAVEIFQQPNGPGIRTLGVGM